MQIASRRPSEPQVVVLIFAPAVVAAAGRDSGEAGGFVERSEEVAPLGKVGLELVAAGINLEAGMFVEAVVFEPVLVVVKSAVVSRLAD